MMNDGITTTMKKYPVPEIWKSFGLSEADWISLARIGNYVAKDGISAVGILPLSSKDQTLGLEIVFERRNSAFCLGLVSRTKELYLEYHRNQDRGVDRYIKGHIDRWETIANQMIHLR